MRGAMILVLSRDFAEELCSEDAEGRAEARDKLQAELEERLKVPVEDHPPGTQVVVNALDDDQPPQVKTIRDDFLLVVDGTCELSSWQRWGSGTVQLTVKGMRGEAQ